MTDFESFYTLTAKDQDEHMPGLYINKPKIVGLVQHDMLNTTSLSTSIGDHMKYFKVPASEHYPLDLNAGYDRYINRADGYFTNKLNRVEYYIMNQSQWDCGSDDDVKEASDGCDMERNYDIVTHRTALGLLMEAPYQTIPMKWTISAIQYNKRLYLMSKKSDEEEQRSPRDQNSTHHFKFEQYCYADDPQHEVDTSVPVDEPNQLSCILKTKLSNLNLLYSSETNGIQARRKISDLADMKILNQSRFIRTKLMKDSIRNWTRNHRMLSWWATSYLVGVNDIYVGLKTSAGLVEQPITHIFVNKLPHNQKWLPKVCITFLHTFITKVIETMRGIDCPHTTFEFAFDSEQKNIKFRSHPGKTGYSFLPDDFVQHLTKEEYKE